MLFVSNLKMCSFLPDNTPLGELTLVTECKNDKAYQETIAGLCKELDITQLQIMSNIAVGLNVISSRTACYRLSFTLQSFSLLKYEPLGTVTITITGHKAPFQEWLSKKRYTGDLDMVGKDSGIEKEQLHSYISEKLENLVGVKLNQQQLTEMTSRSPDCNTWEVKRNNELTCVLSITASTATSIDVGLALATQTKSQNNNKRRR